MVPNNLLGPKHYVLKTYSTLISANNRDYTSKVENGHHNFTGIKPQNTHKNFKSL